MPATQRERKATKEWANGTLRYLAGFSDAARHYKKDLQELIDDLDKFGEHEFAGDGDGI